MVTHVLQGLTNYCKGLGKIDAIKITTEAIQLLTRWIQKLACRLHGSRKKKEKPYKQAMISSRMS